LALQGEANAADMAGAIPTIAPKFRQTLYDFTTSLNIDI
jgi:hypothetical protein